MSGWPSSSSSSSSLGPRALSEKLADRIEALAEGLLPGGRPGAGHREWRVGSLAGEPGTGLRLWLAGPKRGQWRCFKSGKFGDALDLVAAVECGGDLRHACDWARDWLGIEQLDPAEAARLEKAAGIARARRRQEAERAALKDVEEARAVWRAALPLCPGDTAWRYLAGRGIALEDLPEVAGFTRPTDAMPLRLIAKLWNPESRRAWPALVAAISGRDGRLANVHRIWLAPQSNGTVKKAPLKQPKMSMPGGYDGGGVRLWRGRSKEGTGGLPWAEMAAREQGGETLLAGEGIEDVLTLVPARPDLFTGGRP